MNETNITSVPFYRMINFSSLLIGHRIERFKNFVV